MSYLLAVSMTCWSRMEPPGWAMYCTPDFLARSTLSPLDTAAVPKETAADTPLAFSQKRRSWPPRPGVVVSYGEVNSPSDFFKFFSACGGNSARLGGLRPPLPHIL